MNSNAQEIWEGIKKGLPAIVAAAFAITLAAYGKWVLPANLPDYYSEMLAEQVSLYEEATEAGSLSGRALLEQGSAVDICYARLEGLGITTEPWQRLEFYHTHLERLKRVNPESLPEDVREDFHNMIGKYSDKLDRWLTILAAPESPHARDANLFLARNILQRKTVNVESEAIVSRLAELAALSPNDSELNSARVILENAVFWADTERNGKLPPDRSTLETLYRDMLNLDRTPDEFQSQFELLFLTAQSFTEGTQASSSARAIVEQIDADQSLIANFVHYTVAQMVLGDWKAVQSLISQKFSIAEDSEKAELRLSLTKHAARLFYSRLTEDPQWCTNCPIGLDLAALLNPNDNYLQALIWQLSEQHAGVKQHLPAELLESVLISESPQRYLILAISNALRADYDTASKYVDFGLNGDPQIVSRIANLVLWQLATTPETLETESLEPWIEQLAGKHENWLAWLALARLQISGEDFQGADASLQQLSQLIDNEAIKSALRREIDAAALGSTGPN